MATRPHCRRWIAQREFVERDVPRGVRFDRHPDLDASMVDVGEQQREGVDAQNADPAVQVGSEVPPSGAPIVFRPPAALPEWIRPQLTQLVHGVPEGSEWLHENAAARN
jgi:hypothetical protein